MAQQAPPFPGWPAEYGDDYEAPELPKDGLPADDPLELKDDTEVDVKGEKVTLSELRDGYMRTADYTRKTQEVAPIRKMWDLYRTNTFFRSGVDDLGQQALGLKPREEPNQPPPVSDEEWQQRFDEDPRGVLEETVNEVEAASAQRFDQKVVEEAAKAKVEAVWAVLEAEIGEDFPEVETRLKAKISTMDGEQYEYYNRTPQNTARLVKEIHRDMLAERDKTPDPEPDVNPDAVDTTSSNQQHTDTRPSTSPWDMSREKFDAMRRKVVGYDA